MLAQVYDCPDCGDVWRGVQIVEDIDCENDRVEQREVCACGCTVTPKFVDRGGKRLPVMHALTLEEMDEESCGFARPL